jgi:uncharacterized Zn-binding protein involved in type VI secretion
MAGISRVGDKNQGNGAITDGADSVLANGKPVGLTGSKLSEHAPYGRQHGPHIAATVTAGASSVFAEGKPVAMIGSSNSCGHSMVEGSGDIFAS